MSSGDRKLPEGYEDLGADVDRLEKSLLSIGASYRSCNVTQRAYTTGSPETSRLVAGSIIDDEGGGPVFGEDGDLVIPSAPTAADRLEIVHGWLKDCRRCGLGKRRDEVGGKLVFGSGDPSVDVVLIGEAPGENEERSGDPFVGRAGAMLDKILASVLGLSRDQVYVMNLLKCRPERNRDPAEDEAGACRPFMDVQLSILRPSVIVTLGASATRAVLGREGGIHLFRGKWYVYRGVLVRPTFHPAYLLRKENRSGTPKDRASQRKEEIIEKRRVVRDLERVRSILKSPGKRRRLIEMNIGT
jgi:uracil-DNA glycosylase